MISLLLIGLLLLGYFVGLKLRQQVRWARVRREIRQEPVRRGPGTAA